MEFSYSAQDLADFIIQGLGFKVQEKEYAVTLLGLKGCLPVGENLTLNRNEPDFYNDTLSLIWHEEITARHKGLRCTLDPGRRYTEITPHPQGAAHLIECRPMEFKWGKHHGNAALVPARLDVVWRDQDGDYHLDSHERIFRGNFQLRIHFGGTDLASIHGWSAGCIAIFGGQNGEAWQILLKICRRHPFDRFNLIIVRGYDFHHWLLLKECGRLGEFRATIHIGSQGKQVELLQRLLNQGHGMTIEADGDFGQKTLAAFLTAQRNFGIEPKAVCGPGQWERLQGIQGPYSDERGDGLIWP